MSPKAIVYPTAPTEFSLDLPPHFASDAGMQGASVNTIFIKSDFKDLGICGESATLPLTTC